MRISGCGIWLSCTLAMAACGGSGDGDSGSETGDDGDGGDTTEAESEDETDTGPPMNPPRPSFNTWEKVEIPGTLCGNGSQYKFFVNYAENSDDVVFAFEPGGGCWDYPSCSGQSGILGAANPEGIPDSHWQSVGELMVPTRRNDDTNPMKDWNFVIFPYCTGDIHMGNRVTTYEDPEGIEDPLTWHHVQYQNMQLIWPWLQEHFQVLDRMMVTGCSAGGAGSLTNYYFLRTQLEPNRGYLVSDSGPIFPDSEYSLPLHEHIREVWGLDDIIAETPIAAPLQEDLGAISTELADMFPQDRLTASYFRRDFNYSRYSYERWFDPQPDKETIHEYWWDDTQKLMAQYDARDNLGYFIPYWREFNSSHCTTLLTWYGTDIADEEMDMGTYFEHVLDDDAPLQSYLEEVQPDEDTP